MDRFTKYRVPFSVFHTINKSGSGYTIGVRVDYVTACSRIWGESLESAKSSIFCDMEIPKKPYEEFALEALDWTRVHCNESLLSLGKVPPETTGYT